MSLENFLAFNENLRCYCEYLKIKISRISLGNQKIHLITVVSLLLKKYKTILRFFAQFKSAIFHQNN